MTENDIEVAGRGPLAASAGPLVELLSFELAGEAYALPLHRVREILRPPPITEVPRAPAAVLGVISVRGRVTTVVDLRRRLSLPEALHGNRTRILLADSGEETIGLLVDAVLKVHRLHEREIELASSVGGSLGGHVYGIGRPGRRVDRRDRHRRGPSAAEHEPILILLDLDALLSW